MPEAPLEANDLAASKLGQKGRKSLDATLKVYDKNNDGKLSRGEYIDPLAK